MSGILGNINYVDLGDYYSIYGVVSIIVVLLLLWFFVRTNLDSNRCGYCKKNTNTNLVYCDICQHRKPFNFARCKICNTPKPFCNCDDSSYNKISNSFTDRAKYVLSDMEAVTNAEITRYTSTNNHLSDRILLREGMFPFEESQVLKDLPEFSTAYDLPVPETPAKQTHKLHTGMYGGVPVRIYDVRDTIHGSEWNHNEAIYIPNMRTAYKNVITPREKMFWDDSDDYNLPVESAEVKADYKRPNHTTDLSDMTCMSCGKNLPNCLCEYRERDSNGSCLLCRKQAYKCRCTKEELLNILSLHA